MCRSVSACTRTDVLYVPRTWIADMDIVVDQYIRGLIPTLPRVGAGVQVN